MDRSKHVHKHRNIYVAHRKKKLGQTPEDSPIPWACSLQVNVNDDILLYLSKLLHTTSIVHKMYIIGFTNMYHC